jgi:hypothetical protein
MLPVNKSFTASCQLCYDQGCNLRIQAVTTNIPSTVLCNLQVRKKNLAVALSFCYGGPCRNIENSAIFFCQPTDQFLDHLTMYSQSHIMKPV